MKRTEFLQTTGAAALAAGVLPGPAHRGLKEYAVSIDGDTLTVDVA